MGVVVVVGTVKGAAILRSSSARERWEVDGLRFKGWRVTAAAARRALSGEGLAPTSDAGPAFVELRISDSFAAGAPAGEASAEVIVELAGTQRVIASVPGVRVRFGRNALHADGLGLAVTVLRTRDASDRVLYARCDAIGAHGLSGGASDRPAVSELLADADSA